MPAIRVNMKGIPTGFESVRDVGTYTGTFVGVTWKASSKEEGAWNGSLRFTATSPDNYAGKTIFVNNNTTEQGLPFLKQTMVRMGVDPDALEDDSADLDALLKDCVGSEHYLRITLGEGEYNGHPNVNVQVMDPELAERELAATPAAPANAKAK